MNHKILCVDLDATLLCDDKSITQKNREAIHRMLEAGHYIALATGRPVETAREVARELGLNTPGCYMIAFNGAVLYDCAADRVLLKRSLPIEIVQELFDKAKRAGLYVQTYNSTDLITTKHTKELDYYVKQARISYKISPNILDALEEEPQKVISSSQYLEYSPKNTSKATGILELTKILNMPMDATVAVGDEDNDVPMIKTACIGVAVKNATEKAKAAADYVTVNDNNHDAIAEVIEKFIL